MFKVGDVVKCLDPNDCFLKRNQLYIVKTIRPSCTSSEGLITLVEGGKEYFGDRFVLYKGTGMTPHKHAAIIKAWADGAEIEYYSNYTNSWVGASCPHWDNSWEYRIKPEKKPDVVGYIRALRPVGLSEEKEWSFCSTSKAGSDNIKCTFDGETGKLKKVELI